MQFSEFVSNIPNLISNAIEMNEWMGYFVIFIAMFLENIIPPIPSEIIMPLAGFYIFQDQLSFAPVILSGLLGTVAGAFPWYAIGRLANENRIAYLLDKYGKWLGINGNDFKKNKKWFKKYGTSLVFWGRLIPGIRTMISIPAGIELMPLTPFIFWTTAGSLIWTLFLTISGILLGESYIRVEKILQPYSSTIKSLILVAFVGFIFYAGIKFIRKKKFFSS